jgi:hypothetical protein
MEDVNFKYLIESGNKAQIEKLEANKDKHGLGHRPLDFLINKIFIQFYKLRTESCDELELCVCKRFRIKEKARCKLIRSIAANIANYAHMIIVNCDYELENK